MLLDPSWSFMNKIVYGQKKLGRLLEIHDLYSKNLDADVRTMGKKIAERYNKHPNEHLFKTLYAVNKQHFIALCITVCFLALSISGMPTAIKYFQEKLIVSTFYDCSGSGTDITITKIPTLDGIKKIFKLLWPWVVLILVSQMGRSFLDANCHLHTTQLAVKMTSGMLDLMYNKILMLSETTKSINAQGSLANMLFTDTFKLQMFVRLSFLVLEVPLELIIAIIYIAVYVSPIALIGVATIVILIPLVALIANQMQKLIKQLAPLRDQRSQKILEVLNAIKIVKLFNMEDFQEKRLDNIRNQEMGRIRRINMALVFHMMFGFSSYSIMMLVSFGALVGFNKLNLSQSFNLLFLVNQVQGAVGFLPSLITFMLDALVAAKRMKVFLTLPEIDRSFIKIRSDYEKAIEITGKHSFCYGLEEDYQVVPELDPTFFMKRQILKTVKSQNIVPKIKKLLQQMTQQEKQLIPELIEAINNNDYDIKSSMFSEYVVEFSMPATTFHMDLKNYNSSTYATSRSDDIFTQMKKMYMHNCVVTHIKKVAEQNNNEKVSPVIKNFELSVDKGELIGIKGPVGSGKSSIFQCILGEMKIMNYRSEKDFVGLQFDYFEKEQNIRDSEAFIKIGGTVVFCPQSSPIFSMTIRDNICFFKPYDEEKYNRIVDICCLLPDFEIFPAGDRTEVGGRGVTLSGGQRARIALARAVYNDADIYLLDDVLSAVDVHVGQRIWEEVIVGYLMLRGKTVLIASHQSHYFKDCTRIITLAEGQIKSDQKNIDHLDISSSLSKKAESTAVSSQQVQQIQEQKAQSNDGKLAKQETRETGGISGKTYSDYLRSGNQCLLGSFFVCLLVFLAVQQYLPILITHWSTDYYGWSREEFPGSNDVPELIAKYGSNQYEYQVALQCFFKQNNLSIRQRYSRRYLWLMAGVTAAIFVLYAAQASSFYLYTSTAAKNMFRRTFRALIRTELRFFDVTPQGRIINRLVKDIEVLDMVLPRFIFLFFSMAAMVCAMAVCAIAVTWPTAFVILPCLVIYIVIFIQFRSAIPALKRLESVTRSSVFNNCQETLDQLSIIRAYGVEDQFRAQFRENCNANIITTFNAFGVSRWLQFRISVIGACMSFLIALVALLIAPFDPSISSYSGIIVIYGFNIQSFCFGLIDHVSNTESEMSCCERVMEYQQLINEEQEYNKTVQNNQIQIKDNNSGFLIENLKLRYRPELPLALKGVNLHIEPRDHVAVVGRTGSGKSTLAGTCFRLYLPEDGYNMQIDETQLSTMPLYQARRELAIIPQEPFLFSGTLRQQLCEYSRNKAEGLSTEGLTRIPDNVLWEYLSMVQMDKYIKQQPGQLDCQVIGNGDNFSSGQRQLICVIRALLKQSKIVLLDEATAYVDLETDKIIQNIVKEHLKDKIVISIAHRLDTVLSMDKVLVMDAGKVAQFGTKQELYKDTEGIFYSLCKKGGVVVE